MEVEKILCAAIWYKDFDKPVHSVINVECGVVLCGHRHCNIIGQYHSLLGKKQFEAGEYEQGFLTDKNRFVSRETGLKIALAANQVIDLKEVRGNKLYSEDLY